ncbi:MAG: aminoacyl-tRNA hydrolase [Bacteroidota bacterium]|nr:aminoacyl-tRNA hydrolase [Bacteroidota bacterium]
MFIVLGIGNPGSKYRFTRHNAGFLLLDYFAEKNKFVFRSGKGEYNYAEGRADDSDFVLVKPVTYVNNSGFAAVDVLRKFDAPIQNMLVVYDDINLPFGAYRVRASGGSGGHNGISSIIENTGTMDFPRIRIGIGSDFEHGDMADYVLSRFSKEEEPVLKTVFDSCSLLIENFCSGGAKQLLDANSKMIK